MASPFKTVRAFQKCKLPYEQWDHKAHLTVAAFYLQGAAEPAVLAKLRADIEKYNMANGVYTTAQSGYHETLTRFWIARIKQVMGEQGADTGIETLVDECGPKELVYQYYSPEVLDTLAARLDWVPPDRQELECDPGEWASGTPPLVSLANHDSCES